LGQRHNDQNFRVHKLKETATTVTSAEEIQTLPNKNVEKKSHQIFCGSQRISDRKKKQSHALIHRNKETRGRNTTF
jgi:hypothetical protein